MNHGVEPVEIIKGVEVGAVGEPRDLGLAAVESTPKLCVEPRHDFHSCVARRAVLHLPVAIPTNYWPIFILPHVEILLPVTETFGPASSTIQHTSNALPSTSATQAMT